MDSLQLSLSNVAAFSNTTTATTTNNNKNNTTSDNKISTPITQEAKFTCFGKLPTEIRLIIWGKTMEEPRSLEISYDEDTNKFSSRKCTLPVALHVNYESQMFAQGRYRQMFGAAIHEAQIYLDPARDQVHFGTANFQTTLFDCHRNIFAHMTLEDRAALQNVTVDECLIKRWIKHQVDDLAKGVSMLPSAKAIRTLTATKEFGPEIAIFTLGEGEKLRFCILNEKEKEPAAVEAPRVVDVTGVDAATSTDDAEDMDIDNLDQAAKDMFIDAGFLGVFEASDMEADMFFDYDEEDVDTEFDNFSETIEYMDMDMDD